MTLHQARKLVIITERFVAEKVCQIIESHHLSGYTIVAAGGKGSHHTHATSDHASVVHEFSNVKIEAILQSRSTAESIMREVAEKCFTNYSGITYLEDVEILRPEKFPEAPDSPKPQST